jgi:HAD superfamily phosphoserine phosphatase-like hydrolase
MRFVIYDMDLTITVQPTYTRWLIFWACAEAPWRLALLPAAGAVAVAYGLGLISRGRLKATAQALLMGDAAPQARVAMRATAFAERVAFRPGALAQIAADWAEGLEVVIATASFAFYATAIAARLGVATVVATESTWDGDRLRAQLSGDNCYDAAKATMVVARIGGANIVRAYSDHVSDAPLFALATEAVAVNPSFGLRRLAVTRGWRIVDWR